MRDILRRGLSIAILALLVLPVALWAHAHLRRSDPAAHARMSASPTSIALWFSERPELAFTRIQLRRADSSVVPLGAVARVASDPLGVEAKLASTIPDGRYIVAWQTAGADGHVSTGAFDFSVAGSSVAVAPPARSATSDTTGRPATRGNAVVGLGRSEPMSIKAYASTRWVEFVAILAIVGAIVARLTVVRTLERGGTSTIGRDGLRSLADSTRRLGESAIVLLLIADVARLYTEGAAMAGNEHALGGPALRALLRTTWGTGWLIGAAGVVVAAIGLTTARWYAAGWTLAALGAVGIVLEPALTGHAAAESALWLAVSGDALHVAGASAWLGTLLVLVIVGIPTVRKVSNGVEAGGESAVAEVARAYHPLALGCATLVVATGLLSSYLRLPTVGALWQSTYGRILLAKLCVVLLVVLLGALNWRRVLPALGQVGGGVRLRRSASVELGIAAVVLALTAILVSTGTPDAIDRATWQSSRTTVADSSFTRLP